MSSAQNKRPSDRLRFLAILAGGLALAMAPSAGAAAAEPSAGTASPFGAGNASESGSPIADQGSSYRYRSEITSVEPKVTGLGVQVLEFADRLLLTNHTGKTVTIYGYEGEPYARILANGTAEQNDRAPATYLNTNFYADVTVPSSANASDPPAWSVVDRTGQFEWHDHRIHWMSPVTPPQVTDKAKRTKIFDWRVPITVGTEPGAIEGELLWVPESSKAPTGAFVALAVVVVLSLLLVLVVRRRRARRSAPGTGRGSAEDAW